MVADAVPVRVAKYNVTLREAALWAVRAEHEILGNMVAFQCTVCSEHTQNSAAIPDNLIYLLNYIEFITLATTIPMF